MVKLKLSLIGCFQGCGYWASERSPGAIFFPVPARTAALTTPLHQCRRFEGLWRGAQRAQNCAGAKGGNMNSLRTATLCLATLIAGCGGVDLQQFEPKGATMRTIRLISAPNPAPYQAGR